MKVNLNEVEEAIDNVSDNLKAYYYIPEERVIYEDLQDSSQNEIDFEKEKKNLIALPDRQEVDDYGNMESFISTVKDETAAEWLSNAIHGRGAFRMFRAACQRFDLLEDWYDYRQECHSALAEEWCDANGILYEENNIEDNVDEEEEAEPIRKPLPSEKKSSIRVVNINERNYMNALEPTACYLDWINHTHANDFESARTYLEKKLAEGCRIFCSALNGRYTGVAVISTVNDAEDVLVSFCVLEIYRNKGIGTRLMEEIRRQSEEAGKHLLLRVPYERQECLGFFTKNGYQPKYLELMQKRMF